MSNPLLPEVIVKQPSESEYGELYRKWRIERAEVHEVWEPQNIRHEHDPEWRSRLFSIQSAADAKHPVWVTVRVLFCAAVLAHIWFLRQVVKIRFGI